MQLIQVSTFIILGVAVSAQAFGQARNEVAETTENILVTASRSPLTTSDIGSSATIITREEIERRQARYVTDILRSVPGIAVSHSGAIGSQTQVRMRGAEANHVLVLIDGVRANDPASGDEFRWELLSTSNVERIEIVRGPQSSLWGSDALAGVVHIITRSGGNQPKFGVFVESGSHNTLNGGFHAGAGGESWWLGFGLESLDTDGTNVSRSGDEQDGADMTTASLSGQYRPSSNLSLDVGLRAVDAHSEFDPVDFFVTGLPVDGNVATDSQQTSAHAGALLTTFAGRVLHHLNANYFDANNKNLVDGDRDSVTTSERTTLAYQSDVQIGENLLSLALEHERTRFEQRGEIGFGDPNQRQKMTVDSVIADYQGKSVDRLTWLLSGRYDNNSDFDNALTGRLSLVYEINDATRLRSNIGTGQKSPTFTERFGYYPGQFFGNPDLKPEKSTSFEIGFERSLLDDALEMQVTVFKQNLEDEINGFVFDPDTFLFTADNMDGDSSRKGVEFSAMINATEGLAFAVSYTFTDASESPEDGSNVTELRRPEHVGSVSANYHFLDERADITLVADYGGSRSDIFYPPFPEPSEIKSLDSYWLLDLTANYGIMSNTNIYVRATNLLDEDYEQVYGYRTAGRAAYLGFRVDFGR